MKTMRRFLPLTLAVLAATSMLAQAARTPDVQYKAAQYKEQVEGDLKGAIAEYEKVVTGPDRALAAQALLRAANVHQRLGDSVEANKAYLRVTRDFPEQTTAVSQARLRLNATAQRTATATPPASVGPATPPPAPIVVPADRLKDIAVFDRKGTLLLRVSETTPISIVSISPDGQRIAYAPAGNRVMVLDLAGRTRTEVAEGRSPVGWSPDGSRLMFATRREGESGIYATSSYGLGGEDLLLASPNGVYHWSADGRFVVAGLGPDFVAVPLNGDRTPVPILSQQVGSGPRLSPDSQFVAFTSTESPRAIAVRQVNLEGSRPKGNSVTQWSVSPGDALGMTRWRGDGAELYYIAADGGVIAVPIATGADVTAGTPVRLFRTPPEFPLNNIVGQHADVSADGQRFVFLLASPN